MTVRRATLHPDSLRPLGKGKTGAMIGSVRVGGQDLMAIVKPVTPIELAAEVFCSRLADGLGFTTPEPLLVKTPSGIAFGAALLPYPSVVDVFALPEDPAKHGAWLHAVATLLARWKRHGALIALDELIDNRDRNMGNILIMVDEHAPIDHAECLGLSRFAPDNKLATLFVRCGNKALETAAESSAIAASLTFDQNLGYAEKAELSDDTEIITFIDDFLALMTSRRPSLPNRLAARFPKPDQLPI